MSRLHVIALPLVFQRLLAIPRTMAVFSTLFVCLCTTFLSFVRLSQGLADTDTITWGGDNSRTGYETNHNMDPAIVSSADFGQIWRTKLPGNFNGIGAEQIFSQPLVYTLADGIQYVFLATTQNNIYKLNAKTGDIVASRNLHVPFLTADLNGQSTSTPQAYLPH